MNPLFDRQQFRQTLGCFATGVAVVSFLRGDQVCGMTVNSFSSVSLDPPLVLFCPALTTRFALESQPSEPFTISFLSEQQKDVCLHFAGRGGLPSEPWQPAPQSGEGQPPMVQDCLGWLQCVTRATHTHGDHLVVIGEVLQFGVQTKAPPLLFFRGEYPILSLEGEKV